MEFEDSHERNFSIWVVAYVTEVLFEGYNEPYPLSPATPVPLGTIETIGNRLHKSQLFAWYISKTIRQGRMDIFIKHT